MRWNEIENLNELKKTKWGPKVDEIVNDPKFKSWFNGSKVVDSDGYPEIVFHFSRSPRRSTDGKNFSPLTHFGTSNASNERATHDEYRGRGYKNPLYYDGATFPVFLNIRNPILLPDFGHHDIYYWIETLLRMKNSKLGDREEILSLDPDYVAGSNQISPMKGSVISGGGPDDPSKIIPPYLKSHGYDGIKYENKVEHAGSYSWIIMDTKQVKSVFDV